MKQAEALYNWLIDFLEWLANSQDAENFAATLEDVDEEEFARQLELLRGHIDGLKAVRDSREHYGSWLDLFVQLHNLSLRASHLTRKKYAQAYITCCLAEKLAQLAEDIKDENCDEAEFVLTSLTAFPGATWFSHQNGTSFADSIAVFVCDETTLQIGDEPKSLRKAVQDAAVSPRLLFSLLKALSSCDGLEGTLLAITRKTEPPKTHDEVALFTKLHFIAHGTVIHSADTYADKPDVPDKDTFLITHDYAQMGEALYVLSEYNSRTDILSKYLTLYHVVENFMYRKPIVTIERQRGGSMFSLRDFQRLYKETQGGEEDAVKKLFEVAFPLPAASALTLRQKIEGRWATLPNAEVSAADVNAVLDKLGVGGFTHDTFAGGASYSNYGRLVYKLRNGIVHNKETEWHLTYATLGEPVIRLIEYFMLPSLENACFVLLGRPNNFVWYGNRTIKLF